MGKRAEKWKSDLHSPSSIIKYLSVKETHVVTSEKESSCGVMPFFPFVGAVVKEG